MDKESIKQLIQEVLHEEGVLPCSSKAKNAFNSLGQWREIFQKDLIELETKYSNSGGPSVRQYPWLSLSSLDEGEDDQEHLWM